MKVEKSTWDLLYVAGRAKNKCNYDVTSAVKPSSFRYPFLACHVRILSLMYFVIVYCLLVASISGVFSIYLFYLFWSKGYLASFRTSTELINFSPTRNAYSYPLRQVPLIQPDQKQVYPLTTARPLFQSHYIYLQPSKLIPSRSLGCSRTLHAEPPKLTLGLVVWIGATLNHPGHPKKLQGKKKYR